MFEYPALRDLRLRPALRDLRLLPPFPARSLTPSTGAAKTPRATSDAFHARFFFFGAPKRAPPLRGLRLPARRVLRLPARRVLRLPARRVLDLRIAIVIYKLQIIVLKRSNYLIKILV